MAASDAQAYSPPPLESRSLLVLHASVTGTAVDISERIARRGRRQGWAVTVKGVAEFDQVSASSQREQQQLTRVRPSCSRRLWLFSCSRPRAMEPLLLPLSRSGLLYSTLHYRQTFWRTFGASTLIGGRVDSRPSKRILVPQIRRLCIGRLELRKVQLGGKEDVEETGCTRGDGRRGEG
jgi:hypothetical protein